MPTLTLGSKLAPGQGSFKWKNLHRYTGQWVDNYMHGAGRYDWPDGSSYDGQYNMSLKDGHGTFMNKHGHRVICSWTNGKPSGAVVFQSPGYEVNPTVWLDG